jgi:hypothetical protein
MSVKMVKALYSLAVFGHPATAFSVIVSALTVPLTIHMAINVNKTVNNKKNDFFFLIINLLLVLIPAGKCPHSLL